MKRGLAGGLAATFIESKLTPLVIAASILIGAGATGLAAAAELSRDGDPADTLVVEREAAAGGGWRSCTVKRRSQTSPHRLITS